MFSKRFEFHIQTYRLKGHRGQSACQHVSHWCMPCAMHFSTLAWLAADLYSITAAQESRGAGAKVTLQLLYALRYKLLCAFSLHLCVCVCVRVWRVSLSRLSLAASLVGLWRMCNCDDEK